MDESDFQQIPGTVKLTGDVLESILNKATELMNKVDPEYIGMKLKNYLEDGSPMISKQYGICKLYKNRNDIIYEPIETEKNCSKKIFYVVSLILVVIVISILAKIYLAQLNHF